MTFTDFVNVNMYQYDDLDINININIFNKKLFTNDVNIHLFNLDIMC